MIHRRHLNLDGLHVSFLERGTAVAGRSSLVLVHGLMGTAATLRALVKAIRPGEHVVAIDLPGAGLSARDRSLDASLGANAECLARVIAALRLERPIVVGHSHGGAVALQLAAEQPELLRSLVLLAPAHPYFRESDAVVRFYLSLPGRMMAYAMPWLPKWLQMVGLRRMAGPRSWDDPGRLLPYRENLRVKGTIGHLLKLLGTWSTDMTALAARMTEPLQTPALVIWGEADRAVPAASAVQLREHLATAEIHTLPGIGHRPAEETPALTARLIGDWLDRNCVPGTEGFFAPALVGYAGSRAKVVPSQLVMAARMASSFEAGD